MKFCGNCQENDESIVLWNEQKYSITYCLFFLLSFSWNALIIFNLIYAIIKEKTKYDTNPNYTQLDEYSLNNTIEQKKEDETVIVKDKPWIILSIFGLLLYIYNIIEENSDQCLDSDGSLHSQDDDNNSNSLSWSVKIFLIIYCILIYILLYINIFDVNNGVILKYQKLCYFGNIILLLCLLPNELFFSSSVVNTITYCIECFLFIFLYNKSGEIEEFEYEENELKKLFDKLAMNKEEYQFLKQTTNYNVKCKEEKSSYISQLYYWWSFELLKKGYDNGKLEFDDLLNIRLNDYPSVTTLKLYQKYLKNGDHNTNNQAQKSRYWNHLLYDSIYLQFNTFFLSGFLLFISSIWGFLVPYILYNLLKYVEDGSDDLSFGFFLSFLLLFVSLMQSIFEHAFWVVGTRCCFRIQSSLMGLLTLCTLNINQKQKLQYKNGDLINLFAVDCCRIADRFLIPIFHWGTWNSVLSLIVGTILLYSIIGNSVWIGYGFVVLMWPLSVYVGKKTKIASRNIQQFRDKRASILTNLLDLIRVIKVFDWINIAESDIKLHRNNELKAQLRRSLLSGLNSYLSTISLLFAPILSFSYYVLVEGNELKASTAFTAIAYFNLLTRPLGMLPSAITGYADTIVSLNRLEEFFNTNIEGKIKMINGDNKTMSEEMNVDKINDRMDFKDDDDDHSLVNIKFNNINIGYDKNEVILNNVNIKIGSGEFIIVVGPVGSGKSTFLKTLLNETMILSGNIEFVYNHNKKANTYNKQIGYVSERPWIQNATIKENILFGEDFNKKKLEDIIYSCCLEADIESFKKNGGIDMEIGEDGINLSGGQRQRLSLARAVYSLDNSELFLLDDILSALDINVSEFIFNECLVKLLKERGKTIILATHQVQFLKRNEVDQIIILDKNGNVKGFGDYKKLKPLIDELEDIDLRQENNSEIETKNDDVIDYFSDLLDEDESNKREMNEDSNENNNLNEKSERNTTFIQEEKKSKGAISLKLLSTYLKYYGGKIMFLLTILLLLIEQGLGIFDSILLSIISDKTSTSDEKKFAWYYLIVGIILAFITLFRILIIINGTISASRQFHNNMISSLLKTKLSFFDQNLGGRVLNRLIGDIASIDSTVPSVLSDLSQYGAKLLAYIVLVTYELPIIIPFMIVISIPYILLSNFYRWPARDLRRLEAMSKSPLNSQFNELLKGRMIIKSFKKMDIYFMKHLDLSINNTKAYWMKWIGNQFATVWLEFIGILFTFSCAIVGVWWSYNGSSNNDDDSTLINSNDDDDDNNASTIGLLLTYAVLIPNALGFFLKLFAMAEIELVSCERVHEYIELKEEDENESNEMNIKRKRMNNQILIKQEDIVTPLLSSNPNEELNYIDQENKSNHSNNDLIIDNLSMNYHNSMNMKDMILKNVSLRLEDGIKCAIIGRTGAAKSTLFECLLKFYSFQYGTIYVNNKNINMLTTKETRSLFTLVPQKSLLFGKTIRDALVGNFEDINDFEIWNRLEQISMKEKISNLPDKLNTRLYSSISNFSEGELQLLCLVRALLNKKAKIILCDEVSSSLDTNIDRLIHNILLYEDKRTFISICHRLTYIKEFDRVIVMENGEVKDIVNF